MEANRLEGMMAKRPATQNQSKSGKMGVWVAVAVFVVIVAGVVYWLNRPSGSSPESTAVSSPAPTGPTILQKHIYSETADPQADIAAALAKAKQEHKRVILDFGGDWCGDCQVLDIYFHQEPNQDLLEKNFLLVHVWIGHMDRNVDVAAKYGIPLNKGVPALAVLSPEGTVLYSQTSGEFEKMSHMESQSVTDFLQKWKG